MAIEGFPPWPSGELSCKAHIAAKLPEPFTNEVAPGSVRTEAEAAVPLIAFSMAEVKGQLPPLRRLVVEDAFLAPTRKSPKAGKKKLWNQDNPDSADKVGDKPPCRHWARPAQEPGRF